jgi:hypothetical protein
VIEAMSKPKPVQASDIHASTYVPYEEKPSLKKLVTKALDKKPSKKEKKGFKKI